MILHGRSRDRNSLAGQPRLPSMKSTIAMVLLYDGAGITVGQVAEDQLMFYDEIDCRDLFPGNDEREKILIFEVI